MKIKILILILFLFISNKIYSKEKVLLPQLDRSNAVMDYFSSPDEARKYIKTNRKPSDYFKAGYYYYCYSFTLYNDEKKNKKKITSLLKDGSDYLEKALEMESANAAYTAVYGIAYMQWGVRKGIPRVIMTTSKAINFINKAVNMEPDNPDIRLIRLTTFTYFPYKYYKKFQPMIQDDEKIIIKWINELNSLYSKDRKAKEILDRKWGYATDYSTKDEVYFCMGRYYYVELNDKKKGDEYFSKINKNSYWLKRAEQEKENTDKAEG